jgi:putative molybdopterin biosynthesis protein
MTPWEDALKAWMEALGDSFQPSTETLEVETALGRVLAGPAMALTSSPHYHASAVDGVAVRARDTYGADETSPLRLALGQSAVEVNTGDIMPGDFDAVLMVEDVHIEAGQVEITSAASPWQNVRLAGEDIVATEMILPGGHTLRPQDIGALLAGGITRVSVCARPRVTIIPTGSEVVDPGPHSPPGRVPDTNSRVLAALVREWGGVPARSAPVPDEPEELTRVISRAMDNSDVVAVIAGSSAGTRDFTRDVLGRLGRVVAHGIATRPGKPAILAVVQGKPVIGIPGYPVSAVVAAELFLRPLLYRMCGTVPPPRPLVRSRLGRRVVSTLGVEEFVRVKLGRVDGRVVAVPISRGAGLLSSLVRADAVVRVPLLSEGLEEGREVAAEVWGIEPDLDRTLLIIGSHDMSLDLLGQMALPLGIRVSSAHVGSLGGITALRRREAHASGVHLLDEATGEYNKPFVQRLLPGRNWVLVRVATRQQGLMVSPGNPLGIKGLGHLEGDVTFVNRQKGAGTRVLLDHHLGLLGIDPRSINGYDREEHTHMAVASAVKSGAADAGLGILAAARALGLDFVPVAQEPYEILVSRETYDTGPFQALLGIIRSEAFKTGLLELGGYDTRDTGKETLVEGGPTGA